VREQPSSSYRQCLAQPASRRSLLCRFAAVTRATHPQLSGARMAVSVPQEVGNRDRNLKNFATKHLRVLPSSDDLVSTGWAEDRIRKIRTAPASPPCTSPPQFYPFFVDFLIRPNSTSTTRQPTAQSQAFWATDIRPVVTAVALASLLNSSLWSMRYCVSFEFLQAADVLMYTRYA